jgi:hypothetical protein
MASKPKDKFPETTGDRGGLMASRDFIQAADLGERSDVFVMQLAKYDYENSSRRPIDVLEEVKDIIFLMFPQISSYKIIFDFSKVTSAYLDIVKLFRGDFCGYRKCNTRYHDLSHTDDCLLMMARLIHGSFLNGCKFSKRSIILGLLSAILHDTGYIQTVDDNTGTGGKYTVTHIDRSVAFAKKYLELKGYSAHDFHFIKNSLYCTGLNVVIKDIKFQSLENELMGKILGTADLIGQMADPKYLEKLPFLFEEFQEGGIPDYETELDLLQKTPAFWEFTQKRFADELGSMDRYLRDHFRVRWGIDRDLDREAIEKNILRLQHILKNHPTHYQKHLRR